MEILSILFLLHSSVLWPRRVKRLYFISISQKGHKISSVEGVKERMRTRKRMKRMKTRTRMKRMKTRTRKRMKRMKTRTRMKTRRSVRSSRPHTVLLGNEMKGTRRCNLKYEWTDEECRWAISRTKRSSCDNFRSFFHATKNRCSSSSYPFPPQSSSPLWESPLRNMQGSNLRSLLLMDFWQSCIHQGRSHSVFLCKSKRREFSHSNSWWKVSFRVPELYPL